MDKRGLRYFRGYWWCLIQISVKKSFNVFLAIATVVGIITLVLSQTVVPSNSEWRSIMMNLSWQIPAIVFVAAFIIQLFWQPPCLFKEKSDKLQEYETEAIELEGNCIFLSRENVWAARVGIRTVGQKVIRGVVVYLTAIDGDENAYRDAPLSPSGRLLNITGAINVNPGQTQKFIEILHWKPNVEMGIPYNLNYQLQYGGVNIHKSLYSLPTVIPIGNHTVTIYATGENIKPIEREFEVEIIGNELKMRRTDTNNCIEGEKTALTKKEFHLTAFG